MAARLISIKAAARQAGKPYSRIWHRVRCQGMSLEQALEVPLFSMRASASPRARYKRRRRARVKAMAETLLGRTVTQQDAERLASDLLAVGIRPQTQADKYRKSKASVSTTRQRIKVLGWSERKAMSTPSRSGDATLISQLKRYGVPKGTYYTRRGKGWSKRRAMTTPVQPQKRDGKSLFAKARSVGLPPFTVYARVNKLGWSLRRALSTPVGR